MLTIDPVLIDYFASGQPIDEYTYVWIWGRNLETDADEPFGYWTGGYDQTFQWKNRETGDFEERIYKSEKGKAIEVVPVIGGTPSLSELEAIAFQFNATLASVQNNIRGKNLRRAKVEVHKGYYNPLTTKLIANPMLVYLGLVNEGDEDTPPTDPNGEDSDPTSITLTFIPHIRGFKANPKTRSNHTGKSRLGDTFYKWVNVAGGWALRWGRKKKAVRVGRNKNHHRKDKKK